MVLRPTLSAAKCTPGYKSAASGGTATSTGAMRPSKGVAVPVAVLVTPATAAFKMSRRRITVASVYSRQSNHCIHKKRRERPHVQEKHAPACDRNAGERHCGGRQGAGHHELRPRLPEGARRQLYHLPGHARSS